MRQRTGGCWVSCSVEDRRSLCVSSFGAHHGAPINIFSKIPLDTTGGGGGSLAYISRRSPLLTRTKLANGTDHSAKVLLFRFPPRVLRSYGMRECDVGLVVRWREVEGALCGAVGGATVGGALEGGCMAMSFHEPRLDLAKRELVSALQRPAHMVVVKVGVESSGICSMPLA